MSKRNLECVKCGSIFIGTTALYCPKCREEKEKEKASQNMSKYKYASEKAQDRLRTLLKQREAFNKKYFTETTCPNYDEHSTYCLGCPEGAYEFKACGQYKGDQK